MFIREVPKANGSTSIRIVENARIGKKIKQKIVRYVGQAVNDHEIEILKEAAERIIIEMRNNQKPVLTGFAPSTIHSSIKKERRVNIARLREEKRMNNGFEAVFGKAYEQLDLFNSIRGTRKDEEWNKVLKECVIARIAEPRSKRATVEILKKDFDSKIPLEKIYRMMDKLIKNESEIKKRIYNRTKTLLNNQVDVMFFDVTTLYFESFEPDELRNFGFSKDCKFKETQILLSLITTIEGLPLDFNIFSGNTSEGKTLIEVIKELKEKYLVRNVILVADRAMFTEKNLVELEKKEINYIVAAKLKSLNKEMKHKILNDNFTPNVVGNEFFWVNEYSLKGRRLIVNYSSKRAKKDFAERNRLAERLIKKAKAGKIKITDLISNKGTKKYVKITKGEAFVNKDKIELDAKWDGLHGIITNVKDKPISELLERYKDLWQIEAAFRVNKHDLKMRPIYHWKKNRIKAHILICYLAYTLVAHVRYILKIKGVNISTAVLQDELSRIEVSILKHTNSGKKYLLPSSMSDIQKSIYEVMDINYSESLSLL